MRITIRSPRPEDYAAAAGIHNAQNEPHQHTTPQKLAHRDALWPTKDPHYRSYVAETGGKVIATGYFLHSWHGFQVAGRYWAGLYVHQDYRRQGVDTKMLQHAIAEQADKVREVWTVIREDFVPKAGFLEGFEEQFRTWGGELDLHAFEPARFDGLKSELKRNGIHIVRYQDLENDPERDAKIQALHQEAVRDMPHHEPVAPKERDHFRSPDTHLDAYLVAMTEDGSYVGIASLTDGHGDTVHWGLTGVTRAHRKRGIGTALKAGTATIAKTKGYHYLNEGGAGTGTPIMRVNQKLGFEIEPAWITLAKTL
ncbi:MAG TPA: GNAT family N-acetyltransferase [Trueperaceae bacterium]